MEMKGSDFGWNCVFVFSEKGMTSRKWRRYVREELYRRRRLWRGRKIVWHRKSKPSELVQVLNCRDNMLFAVHVPLCPWVAGRGQERRLLETLAESDSVQCLTIDKVLPKDAEKPDVYMLERGLASLSAKNQLKVLRLHSIGHHPIRLPKLPSSLEVLELTKFVLTAHIVDTIVDSPMPNLVALHLLDFRGDVRWSTRESNSPYFFSRKPLSRREKKSFITLSSFLSFHSLLCATLNTSS